MVQSDQTVHILMGVYNGAAHLDAQLASLMQQTHGNWRLLCSDDGSTDESLAILSRFAETAAGRVEVKMGPRQGFVANFRSMIEHLPDRCGMVAFCDQDDIWLPEKLARGVKALATVPADVPALYGAASWVWDDRRDVKKPSQKQRFPPTFRNAIIENFAAGNTMILNEKAATLLRDSCSRIGPIYAHDWWAYALVAGAGGRVVYDEQPALLYRQHGGNEIGAAETFWKRHRRNMTVAAGQYRRKFTWHLDALSEVREMLTEPHQDLLDAVKKARMAPAILRPYRLWQTGVHRQSRRDMIGFLLAALIGKV